MQLSHSEICGRQGSGECLLLATLWVLGNIRLKDHTVGEGVDKTREASTLGPPSLRQCEGPGGGEELRCCLCYVLVCVSSWQGAVGAM